MVSNKGEKYKCEECGLVIVVEEPCNCDECAIICCQQPMKKEDWYKVQFINFIPYLYSNLNLKC